MHLRAFQLCVRAFLCVCLSVHEIVSVVPESVSALCECFCVYESIYEMNTILTLTFCLNLSNLGPPPEVVGMGGCNEKVVGRAPRAPGMIY